ncbi:MAG: class 1 fructose-bisphosphatase [Candidatus Margulisiibacteriota bacterium]|nr:class 1 fructose-bisphosphatase [Candidatus Margulisiibacteriota bacterium]
MNLTTIERHIIDNATEDTEIANILYDINVAAKLIRQKVIRAGLNSDILGKAGTTNSSGEDVQALDIYSNNVMKEILSSHQRFSFMGSEEETDVVQTNSHESSEYVILFDPLDGSSNIDVNVSVGTIFSIYKKDPNANTPLDHCLQKGIEQVAAGYVIYGSSVVMVYTAGNGVHGFTYDPTIGEFILSHENITIPKKAKYYSVNESLYPICDDQNQTFFTELKEDYSLRYVGSLVADFHRNLLKGGLYIYPGTSKSPNGKLRLLYEANPLAFICEQAGGAATDGEKRILDIKPTELHQRVPLYIGSSELIDQYNQTKIKVLG